MSDSNKGVLGSVTGIVTDLHLSRFIGSDGLIETTQAYIECC